MPYKSDKQRKYFNANKKRLKDKGVDVDKWNEESKGKELPTQSKDADALRSVIATTQKRAMLAEMIWRNY
jgi:hypothetical protein